MYDFSCLHTSTSITPLSFTYECFNHTIILSIRVLQSHHYPLYTSASNITLSFTYECFKHNIIIYIRVLQTQHYPLHTNVSITSLFFTYECFKHNIILYIRVLQTHHYPHYLLGKGDKHTILLTICLVKVTNTPFSSLFVC